MQNWDHLCAPTAPERSYEKDPQQLCEPENQDWLHSSGPETLAQSPQVPGLGMLAKLYPDLCRHPG